TPEVSLEPTPGHTPGHVSVRIVSRGEEAVITGDLMHHPVQCAQPGWASRFDVDAQAARRTRLEFLNRHADRPVLVLGTHFATPIAMRATVIGRRLRPNTISTTRPPNCAKPFIDATQTAAAVARPAASSSGTSCTVTTAKTKPFSDMTSAKSAIATIRMPPSRG